MADFQPAPLPGFAAGDEREVIAAGIANWLDSAAMAALLVAFGHRPPVEPSLAGRLADIEKFSERWDYRKGLERHQAKGETFEPELDRLIRSATTALGLLGRRGPRLTEYDDVLVLGGGIRTMMARTSLAAESLDAGATTSTVAGLGSTRPLEGHVETARQLHLGPCPTEGDAVDESLRAVFGLGEPTAEYPGPNWWSRFYADVTPTVSVLAAPSSQADRRANTADTLAGWAELIESDPRGRRLLLVTTDIFVLFQHCDALRVLGLPFDCDIDTIGFATDANPFVDPTRTYAVLQEVRSAVRSMQLLHRALA